MKYARMATPPGARNFCTVHLAADDCNEKGHVLCGKLPTVNSFDRYFRGDPERWEFHVSDPSPEPEFLCKRCQKAASRRGRATAVAATGAH